MVEWTPFNGGNLMFLIHAECHNWQSLIQRLMNNASDWWKWELQIGSEWLRWSKYLLNGRFQQEMAFLVMLISGAQRLKNGNTLYVRDEGYVYNEVTTDKKPLKYNPSATKKTIFVRIDISKDLSSPFQQMINRLWVRIWNSLILYSLMC